MALAEDFPFGIECIADAPRVNRLRLKGKSSECSSSHLIAEETISAKILISGPWLRVGFVMELGTGMVSWSPQIHIRNPG